ncbi:predicted protein [Arabidopsis lyrata subsp. lyrata]|uniref:Predicted protein n=2 Tax=Arabidopsis lyrata subsp. lyrata TaxID=81972 RepID=D7L2R6_ARALL|nr:predicted protein [Arabidopsis lyrata subsp. lyrata]EFH62202.1 predicted protein [Arabidopsis lyrata subsp. lyrata]
MKHISRTRQLSWLPFKRMMNKQMGLRDDLSYLKRRMMRSSFSLLSQTTEENTLVLAASGFTSTGSASTQEAVLLSQHSNHSLRMLTGR